MFKETDYNNDGLHTFDELVSKPSKKVQNALAEWTQNAENAISKADKDGNGYVSWAEFKRIAFPDEL